MISVERLDAKAVAEQKRVSIGRLSPEMIADIRARAPEIGARLSPDVDIVFWADRVEHTERHRDDFFSTALYDRCLEEIPLFIREPDYIAAKGDSLTFIRVFSQNVAVAVRVSASGALSYRTMYVITEAQIEHFISRKTAWRS